MRVLITGAAGQIGWRLVHALKGKHHVVAALRAGLIEGIESVEMDIQVPLSVRLAVDRVAPDAVIHCAAMTNVELCEKNREECWHINVEGTRALAEECSKTGSKMVYISTDLVFDGEKGDYTEADRPNPQSWYARSKLEGEGIALSQGPRALVARTSIVVGNGGIPPRGFTVWLVDSLRRGETVKLFTDQYRSHFYLGDLGRAVMGLLEADLNGIYHCSPGRKETRYDFGVGLAKAMGFDPGLIKPVAMKEVPSDARRVKDVSLANDKLRNHTGFSPSTFEETLASISREFPDGRR